MLALLAAMPATPGQARTPVNTACRTASARALPALASADKSLARGDVRTANTMLDTALHALGDSYYRPEMIDDTGMHLTLAKIQEGKGRLGMAVSLKRRVLKERLELCGTGSKL